MLFQELPDPLEINVATEKTTIKGASTFELKNQISSNLILLSLQSMAKTSEKFINYPFISLERTFSLLVRNSVLPEIKENYRLLAPELSLSF